MDEEGNRHLSFDIFALGLVIGFSASSGVHPFDRNLEMAHKRIKKQKPMTLTTATRHKRSVARFHGPHKQNVAFRRL